MFQRVQKTSERKSAADPIHSNSDSSSQGKTLMPPKFSGGIKMPSLGGSAMPPQRKRAQAPVQKKETAQKKEDGENQPLNVAEGQLTFDAEGSDDPKSPYFTRVIHYPPVGDSGVTVGRGYDMGNRTEKAILAHMKAAGVPADKAAMLGKAAKKKGKAAAQYVKDYKSKIGMITHDQQKSLFSLVYNELKSDAIRLSSKKDVVAAYGATDFDNLHPAILELLVDLRYRGDYKPSTRKWIQKHIANNDLKKMASIMADTKWKTTFGVPKDRFNRRKTFMENAVKGKTTNTLAGNETETAKPEAAPSSTIIKTGTVNAAKGLNVRGGLGTSNPKVGKLMNGESVSIYQEKDGWYRIGENQWVHAGYIVTNAQSTEKPATETESAAPATEEKDEQTRSSTGDTWDSHTNRRIGGLHPAIQASARTFVNRAQAELGIKLRVTSGLRTFAEQDALYAKGRTAKGGKVTNAQGGESYHNYGLAIDVVEITASGQANWSGDWAKIGAMGQSAGFEWGGSWSGFVDKPHFQMPFGLSVRELNTLYNANGGNFVSIANAPEPVAADMEEKTTPEVSPAAEEKTDNGNKTSIGQGTVTASTLNVRDSSSTKSNVVDKLSSGASVQVYEQKGAWLRIGEGKWIHGNYVDLTKKEVKEEVEAAKVEEEKGPETVMDGTWADNTKLEDAWDYTSSKAGELYEWLTGSGKEAAAPVKKPAPKAKAEVKSKIDDLMKKDRLTPAEIKTVRGEIDAMKDVEAKKKLYIDLQSKVAYVNQRQSMSKEVSWEYSRKEKATASKGGNVYADHSGGGMCNLSSLAMVLQYLGISNPYPDLKYQDALEKKRVDLIEKGTFKKSDKRINWDVWERLAKELGASKTKRHYPGVKKKAWYEQNLLPALQSGAGIMLSFRGHIVRLENITEKGFVVDDPYGKCNIVTRDTNGKGGWKAYNGKRGAESKDVGEDNVWVWSDIEKVTIRGAVIVYP